MVFLIFLTITISLKLFENIHVYGLFASTVIALERTFQTGKLKTRL